MTDSHFGNRWTGGPLPEIPVEGLVLWRLHSYEDEWWCTVENFADCLILRVHTPDDSRTALTETLGTATAVVSRADELCAQYLTQGWTLRETARNKGERDPELAMMTIWFSGPDWEITGVESQSPTAISPATIMGRSAPTRLLTPDLVSLVHDALAAAAAGTRQVLYFKAVRDTRVDWRRGVLSRDAGRVRMDIFETTETESVAHAFEVDLRS